MAPRSASPRSQRGLALMVILIMLAIGATFLVLRSLNASTTRADRYRVSQDVLIQAKEALIARAVTDDPTSRPGSLPCPDTDDDGSAELFAGNACPSYIGRLPWKTLGLPDLRDASGERLWYALSPTYRDHPAAQPINSATAGQLQVFGTQPSNGVVALIIAPGSAVVRAGAGAVQTRGNPSVVCATVPAALTAKCNPANYLEISGGIDNANGDSNYVSAVESASFNDRLLEVTVEDIMSLVEKRAGRDLAGKLRTHFDNWQNSTTVVGTKGFYPWAAPFNDPGTASPGVNNTQTGQLPMSTANVVWSNYSMTLGNCVVGVNNQLVCTGLVVCAIACLTPINARLNGIATAFLDPPDGTEVTTNFGGLTVLGVPPAGTWTMNLAQQALNFNWSGTALLGVGVATVTIRPPAASAWTTSATDYLATNRWDQVTHYSVSPRFALTGTNACSGAGPGTCITLDGATDRQAVVTMTGRALVGQDRTPPTAPAAYLEGGNADPTDLALERNLLTSTFNDQPFVVRP